MVKEIFFKGQSNRFYISSDFITLKEVVDTFNEVSKNKVNVVWPEDYSSNSYIQAHVTPKGWKPKYNLTMGLTEILKVWNLFKV